MFFYPQLSSGSLAQYPIRRSYVYRTVINSIEDGSQIRFADSVSQVRWMLTYAGLTDVDRGVLEAFFMSVQGRLNKFTFLDPMDNLLGWSEDLSQSVWATDPLISIGGRLPDAFGGTSGVRLTNSGQATQNVTQTISAPGSYNYCMSAYVRGQGSVELIKSASSGTSSYTAVLQSSWSKVIWQSAGAGQDSSIKFGIALPPGAQMDLCGLQVEAQPGAGLYKRTTAQAGVYPNSRFDQDVFTSTATGVNAHSVSLKIVSNVVLT